jgi:SAM-dependent methyltransferase
MEEKMNKETQKPLINWDEFEKMLFRRMGPPPGAGPGKGGGKRGRPGPGRGIGGWDKMAANYNRMIHMEGRFTLEQVNCFDTAPTDTALDIGCGPGRVTMKMAARAKSVTALDASPKMLEFCEANCKAEGLTNVRTMLCDWEDEKSAKKIGKHDIVIASRSPAMADIERLASLARKYVVLIIWANGGPCIPQIIGALFEGADGDGDARPHMPPRDRRVGNNILYNKVYDLGYDPNVRIVDDGFEKTFKSRDEAYKDLLRLGRDVKNVDMDIFRSNVDRYLTEKEDGSVDFLAGTKTMVLWFRIVGS